MIRLFVAVELPFVLRERLGFLCAGVPGARWVATENMHLTLRFIGEVANDQAQHIDDALATVQAEGFAFQLDGVGFFGKPTAARVLWVGVRRCDPLIYLQRKIETALCEAGLPPESRKFSPHVTLARLRNAPGERLRRFVAENGAFESEPVTVDRFVLYSSFRSASGPIYTPEADYPLTG